MKNSRAKGNKFELDVARQLAAWWFPNKYPVAARVPAKELPFRRTPLSGGWSRKRVDVLGDIMTPKSFPFLVEAKNRQSWDWPQMFKTNDNAPLDQWWTILLDLAEKASKEPLMIFTRNNAPTYVQVNPRLGRLLRKERIGQWFIIRGRNYTFLDDLITVEKVRIQQLVEMAGQNG